VPGPPPLTFKFMATLTINGRSVSANPNKRSSKRPAAGILDIPTCAGSKLLVVGIGRICLVSVEGQAKLLRRAPPKWRVGWRG